MKYLLVLSMSFLFCSCSSINKWVGLPDDNFIEEAAEDVVQHEVGINFDFTPDSPEE